MHVGDIYFPVAVHVHPRHRPFEQEAAELQVFYYVVHVLHVLPRVIKKLAAEIKRLLDNVQVGVVHEPVAVDIRVLYVLDRQPEGLEFAYQCHILLVDLAVTVHVLVIFHAFCDRRQVALVDLAVRSGERLSRVILPVGILVDVPREVRPFYVPHAYLHGREPYDIRHAGDVLGVKHAVLREVREIRHHVAQSDYVGYVDPVIAVYVRPFYRVEREHAHAPCRRVDKVLHVLGGRLVERVLRVRSQPHLLVIRKIVAVCVGGVYARPYYHLDPVRRPVMVGISPVIRPFLVQVSVIGRDRVVVRVGSAQDLEGVAVAVAVGIDSAFRRVVIIHRVGPRRGLFIIAEHVPVAVRYPVNEPGEP